MRVRDPWGNGITPSSKSEKIVRIQLPSFINKQNMRITKKPKSFKEKIERNLSFFKRCKPNIEGQVVIFLL